MNLTQARDLVRAYLTQYGDVRLGAIDKTIVDNIINIESQNHFNSVKKLHGYWHTLLNQGMNEYLLPSSLISISFVALSGERYYGVKYPYVEGVKTDTNSRTRVTVDGLTVDASSSRWYWVTGRSLFVHPIPEEDTPTVVTGSCTISSSTVTVSSGNLGTDNTYKDYAILIGSSYFIILSHDSSAIVVDGTPDDTQVTYSIYNKGLQLRGVKTSDSLTVGSSDDIPGSDLDAQAIIVKTAYNLALTYRPKDKQTAFDMSGLKQLHSEYLKRATNDMLNLAPVPIGMSPFRLRSYSQTAGRF
ncbi:MAG: hypothetical protein KAS32_15150 [Candidatus Peribacteraceae bacterium]|nr:hypothetical protein [Candidatus Peribacteraceae bacterium]